MFDAQRKLLLRNQQKSPTSTARYRASSPELTWMLRTKGARVPK